MGTASNTAPNAAAEGAARANGASSKELASACVGSDSVQPVALQSPLCVSSSPAVLAASGASLGGAAAGKAVSELQEPPPLASVVCTIEELRPVFSAAAESSDASTLSACVGGARQIRTQCSPPRSRSGGGTTDGEGE